MTNILTTAKAALRRIKSLSAASVITTLVVLIDIALVIAGLYVAWHFINKYW